MNAGEGFEATRILAIRHGETDWNRAGRLQGQLDVALNATGLAQAERVAERLATEQATDPVAAIYSSDLLRAQATAATLARACGLSVTLAEGLRERRLGVFERHTPAEIDAGWPEAAPRWRRREPEFAPPGAESLRAFAERSVQAALTLARRHPGATIALVTHGGVLDCLYRAATRVDLQAPRTWDLPNGAINRLLLTEDGFTLIGWADAGHLERPGAAEASDVA